MSTYKATFTTTAEIIVELEIEAPNQQEALIAAHDEILKAQLSQAKVVKINHDKAVNTSLELLGGTPTEPQRPAAVIAATSGKQPYRVEFFPDRNVDGIAAFTREMAQLAVAKQQVDVVTQDEYGYGAGKVVDTYSGMTLYKVVNARGGWEVEALGPNGELIERQSWLESSSQALKSAVKALKGNVHSVRVVDFTQRSLGPVVRKVIQ